MPTVVVGDLGFGGAGKTAVVAHLAQRLVERGRVAIVGHGYRGRVRRPTRLTHPDADAFGDEAAALYRALGTLCEVWVGDDRVRTCAAAQADADVIVVDRGLGDTRLERTVDVVVVDVSSSTAVFPAGPLKAPLSSVSPDVCLWAHHQSKASDAQVGSIGSLYIPRCVRRAGWDDVSPQWLAGRPVVTLCGLANPRSFYQCILDAGASIVGGLEVGDHRPFPARHLARLPRDVVWLTTAKDRERLPPSLEIAVLDVDLEIVRGQSALDALCTQLLPV